MCDHKEASNQRKRSKGATRANILCSACGSSTHKRPTHRDCPFNSAAMVDSEEEESSVAAASSGELESDSLEFEPPTGMPLEPQEKVFLSREPQSQLRRKCLLPLRMLGRI